MAMTTFVLPVAYVCTTQAGVFARTKKPSLHGRHRRRWRGRRRSRWWRKLLIGPSAIIDQTSEVRRRQMTSARLCAIAYTNRCSPVFALTDSDWHCLPCSDQLSYLWTETTDGCAVHYFLYGLYLTTDRVFTRWWRKHKANVLKTHVHDMCC